MPDQPPTVMGTLAPVYFETSDTKWEVTLNEDGSLAVFPIGRRPGRVHIMPCSHTSVVITTDRLIRENAR